MNKVVIGAGSNINPGENIKLAKEKLSGHTKLINTSKFVKTEPIGYKDQNDFYNGAFLVNTEMRYKDLRELLKDIEKDLGRKRTGNINGPRTIDLDILIWNDRVVDQDVYDREFLQEAIRELMPGFYL